MPGYFFARSGKSLGAFEGNLLVVVRGASRFGGVFFFYTLVL